MSFVKVYKIPPSKKPDMNKNVADHYLDQVIQTIRAANKEFQNQLLKRIEERDLNLAQEIREKLKHEKFECYCYQCALRI